MQKRDVIRVLGIWGLVQLLYWPARKAGLVTDVIGMFRRLEEGRAIDIWTSFGFPAVQPLVSAWWWTLYHLVGTTPLAYHLATSIWHVLNAYLLLIFLRQLSHILNLRIGYTYLWLILLVWVCSPYHTDVVVWKACFNWLGSTTCILLGLITLLIDWQRGRWLTWRTYLCFTLGLLFFELAVVLPMMSGFLALTLFRSRREWMWALLPQMLLLGVYFLLSKWLVGDWIGHYGPEVHMALAWSDIAAAPWRYSLKTLFLLRYASPDVKHDIFTTVAKPAFLWPAWLVLLAGTSWMAFRFRRLRPATRMLVILLGLSIITILPVSNLYFSFLLHIENDRYGYLMSGFLWAAVGMGLYHTPKWLRYGSLVVALLVSGFFLHKTVGWWQQSNAVYRSLLANFRWTEHPKVWLLNLPENLEGAVLFRDYSDPPKAFTHALRYLEQRHVTGELTEVAYYNLVQPEDDVRVQELGADTLQVVFNQYGNWWWRRGIGLSDYSTADYHVDKRQYDLLVVPTDTLDPPPILLIQSNGHWQVVE